MVELTLTRAHVYPRPCTGKDSYRGNRLQYETECNTLSCVKGKEFIYYGEPSEKQSAFTDRVRQLHPAAQIVPKGEVEELEGQYLQITPVSAYRDLEHPIYQ